MKTIDDEELTRFLLRDLPSQRLHEIQQLVDTDEEFAARVEVNRFMIEAIAGVECGFDRDKPATSFPRARRVGRFISRYRVLAMVMLGIVVLATTATATWFIWNAPLMKDDLSSGWFDASVWRPPPAEIEEGGVRAERGCVRLVNRGYLSPRREFAEPIDLRFEWKWVQLGLNPHYAEHLSVALRTEGVPNKSFFWEASDGLIVKFNAWGGFVNIMDSQGNELARTPTRSHPIPAEEWHKIRITDDGEEISVYLSGPLIQPAGADTPALRLRHRSQGAGRHIAIYNREQTGVPHESCIRNFVIYAFPAR